jgi:hypothetical protein
LILLADRMDDRRVVDGLLGCPNCRDGFPVRGGFGDLRAPPRGGDHPQGRAGPPGVVDEAEAARIMALVGVAEGPGTVLLAGSPSRYSAWLAEAIPGVEVVGLDPDLVAWPESPRVSRIMARPGIPIFDRTLRGVAVDGALGARWIREAARVIAPLARVVVTDAPGDAAAALLGAGLKILAAEGRTVVAARG